MKAESSVLSCREVLGAGGVVREGGGKSGSG